MAMARPVKFFIFLFFSLGISINDASEETSEEVPDFFSSTAQQMAEMIKQQMLSNIGVGTLDGKETEQRWQRWKRSEEVKGDILKQPQMQTSTLRAQASGSAIPSPTMFIGGFSLMMMPAPEGEAIFNRIMGALPNNPVTGK